MVLGTAQFGMEYGITNLSGKPSKKEVFDILDVAWEKGIRCFDTAPDYGSEIILGEFISANGLQNEVKVLTKIPSLTDLPDFKNTTKTSIESSLENIGCPIEVLFLHKPEDSELLLKHSLFFEDLLIEFPVSNLGVSVYGPQEVKNLQDSYFDLAYQFPFNVLDRRFKKVNMPHGKRYARSIFLQGLLASPNGIRANAPEELLNLQRKYHEILVNHDIKSLDYAISFVVNNDDIDYFLIGVETKYQICEVLNVTVYDDNEKDIIDKLYHIHNNNLLDPRKWPSL